MSSKSNTPFNRRQMITASLGAAGVLAAGAATVQAESQTKMVYGLKPLKGKKVLVAIGDFSEGMETYYMVYRLMEEGVEPVVAASSAKRLQMVVHDFEPEYTNYTEKLGYFIQTHIAYDDVKPADYDALLIPGGRGPEEIRQYASARELVSYFLDNKRPLGAICHGPQLLYAGRSLKGRRMTSYSGIRLDVEAAGATYVDEPVVVDGNLVTSRGWPDLPYFMVEFLNVLSRG
jgi:protease I